MPKVHILQHAAHEGPGYVETLLQERGIDYAVAHLYRHDPLPDARDIRGLILMGGPMSVNDEAEYPWLRDELALIRDTVAAGIPTLGHCLGGQLISKALGGTIGPNPQPEIGWFPVYRQYSAIADHWLGDLPPSFEVFHWHGETFSLPPGATHLLYNETCANQGFAIEKHVLGFQCHPEMTETLVITWSADIGETAEKPSVQSRRDMRENLSARVHQLNIRARTIYRHWIGRLQ